MTQRKTYSLLSNLLIVILSATSSDKYLIETPNSWNDICSILQLKRLSGINFIGYTMHGFRFLNNQGGGGKGRTWSRFNYTFSGKWIPNMFICNHDISRIMQGFLTPVTFPFRSTCDHP